MTLARVTTVPLDNGMLINHPSSRYCVVVDFEAAEYRLTDKETGQVLSVGREEAARIAQLMNEAQRHPTKTR